VLATTLSVLLGLPSPSQAAAPATPRVGQCHQLTTAQAWAAADPKRPVSCSKRHDLQTVAVVTASTSLAGMTADEVSSLGGKLCGPKQDRALGRNARVRELTAYSEYFFSPTQAQIDAGARWFRCDITLVAGTHLASLPKKRLSKPIIGSRIDDGERRCLTGRFLVTTCTQRHVYRSLTAFRVRTTAYPTSDQVVAAADRRCPKGWNQVVWPSTRAWAHGHHFAVCYDKTKK
jgi:hypothetical protein